mgnify:CR=1 FL=1
MTDKYMCAVSVASIWPDPSIVRTVDQYGIARPALISDWIDEMTRQQREALCYENRIVTQVLYGEELAVDEIQGEWAKVRAIDQPYRDVNTGYPGWMPIVQLEKNAMSEGIGYVKVKELRTQLFTLEEMPLIVLSFNTVLPVLAEEEHVYIVATPHGKGKVPKFAADFAAENNGFQKKDATAIANEMLKFLDIPYFWAGMSSYGYDCSGLTYNAMKACGYKIPRDASDQAKGGHEVDLKNREAWQSGDLVFFSASKKEKVSHVGIYLDNNRLLHTSILGKKIEVINLQGHPLNQEVTHVRRYI